MVTVYFDATRGYQEELDAVLEEMNETNRRLERLYDAVETGKIPLADLAPESMTLNYTSKSCRKEKYRSQTVCLTGKLNWPVQR
jgi:hypothetical protein